METEQPYILSGWRFAALILTVILSVVGYLLFSFWGGWDDVVSAVSKVGISGLLIISAFAFTNYLIRFFRWQKYLNVLGYHVPWWPSFRIYLSGFTLTATPGKAGETLRSVFLKDHGIEYRSSIGAFLSERFSDAIASVLLITGALVIYPMVMPVFIGTMLLIGAVLIVLHKESWFLAIKRRTDKLHGRIGSFISFFMETVQDFRICFSPTLQSHRAPVVVRVLSTVPCSKTHG